LFLILEFAVINQATHRRCGHRCNFNQVHIQISCGTQGLSQRHDAQGFALGTRDSNLRGRDFTVQTVLAFLALATVTKFGSDD
jgi:hypothetical protein